jgi:DNA-binding response OmpR family regulator
MCKILIVDDEEIIRNFLYDFLVEEGYSPDLASDGDEAITKINQFDYDLVVTDIKMPNVGGIEVLKAAKLKNPKSDVIMITGYSSMENRNECLKWGASAYLAKPFQLSEFREIINKRLEKHL